VSKNATCGCVKVRKKGQKLSCVKLAICPDYPRRRRPLKFCVLRRVREIVIHFKFHENRSRGLGAVGGRKSPSPIDKAHGLYNSLYYRTSRDRTGILSLFDDLILCPLEGFNSMQNCVTLRQTVYLQPYSESILPVQVPLKYSSSSVLIEPLIDQSALPVRIAGTLCTTKGRCGIVRVLNATAEPVTVRRFTKLGTITTLNCINSIQPLVPPKETKENDKNVTQTSEILEAFAKKYKFQISSELTQEQRYELLNVLYEFKDTFALEITDMKIHQNYEAHLELKQPGTTVRARQFPLSKQDAAEIDKQILDVEEMGLIEKSEGTTFNSPIFLIKKKHTGKTRFVVDLRKVNDVL